MSRKKAEQKAEQEQDTFRPCQAANCREAVEAPKFFCDAHWSMVPSDVQMALFDAIMAGSKDFVSQVLRKAIALIMECERQQNGAP